MPAGGQQMTTVTGSSLASCGVVWKWQETGAFSGGLEFLLKSSDVASVVCKCKDPSPWWGTENEQS